MTRINHIGRRGGLCVRDVDRFAISQVFVIGIEDRNRAIGSANPARRAFCFIYETGLLLHFHREASRGSRDFLQGGIADDFDVGVSGRLNEPGG